MYICTHIVLMKYYLLNINVFKHNFLILNKCLFTVSKNILLVLFIQIFNKFGKLFLVYNQILHVNF